MFKSLLNIFLVIIICITTAGVPVDKNIFDFEMRIPATQNQQITYSLEPNIIPMNNPNTVSIIGKSENNISHLLDTSFTLEVIKDNSTISYFKDSDFIVSQESPSDTEIMLELNISQHNLNLPAGNYMLRFFSDNLKEQPLNFEVVYKPIAPYISAKNDLPIGLMNLSLYFPDPIANKHLVPITRFVRRDKAVLRTTVNNLYEGSSILGFQAPIPRIPKLELRGDLVTVHLPDNLGKFHENEIDGYFALNSLVDSLTSISGINRVKFLVNGRESNNIFYSHSTATIFTPSIEKPKIYFGLNINEARTLLVPVDMLPREEQKLYTDMFNSLQTGIIDAGTPLADLIATVPSDIRLLNATKNNQTLVLNFSKEFLYAHPDRVDLQRLMIDSLLFSYTSISDVTQVHFTVENQVVDTFANLQLAQPLSRPRYINPEKE